MEIKVKPQYIALNEEKKTDTSSIGPQWPPQVSSFNRIKGIDNRGVVRDSTRLLCTLEEIDYLKQSVLKDNTGIDRLSVRIIADDDVWIKHLDAIDDLGEVIIPLSGTKPEFENSSMLYLGYNTDGRQSDPTDLNLATENVEQAMKRKRSSYSDITTRAQKQGFILSILNPQQRLADETIQDQMTVLYTRFGWERKDVLDILSKEANIIAVAFSGDKIVCAGIAETSIVPFMDGAELRMAEITEAATDEKYQGRGLYSAVSAQLMRELFERSLQKSIFNGEIDLVFGELNGNAPGVLNHAKSQGRTFAIEVSRQLGLPFKGFLPQHVPIAGAPRSTPYNDLFPAFMKRKGIQSFLET